MGARSPLLPSNPRSASRPSTACDPDGLALTTSVSSSLGRTSTNGPRLLYITTVPDTLRSFLKGQNLFMKDRGFELFAASSPGSALQDVSERDGVQVFPVDIPREIRPLQDLRALFGLRKIIREVQPDLVHVSTPKAALLGALAGAWCQVPIRLFLIRGLATEKETGLRRTLYRCAEALTAACCHESVAVSTSLLEFARSERIVGPGVGRVAGHGMSNGIDVSRFDPDTTAKVKLGPFLPSTGPGPERWLGFVGRLTRDKGIEDLAEAWLWLRDRYPDWGLILVGRWSEYDRVSNAVRVQLEEDPRVVLPGLRRDVPEWLNRMDLFLFPSHGTEGFPNSPMEAAAMALPVVGTQVVGSVDAVEEGVTGTLVPPKDVPALTEAASRYMENPDLRENHGRAGRERVVKKFQREQVWEGLYSIYEDLLTSRGIRAL